MLLIGCHCCVACADSHPSVACGSAMTVCTVSVLCVALLCMLAQHPWGGAVLAAGCRGTLVHIQRGTVRLVCSVSRFSVPHLGRHDHVICPGAEHLLTIHCRPTTSRGILVCSPDAADRGLGGGAATVGLCSCMGTLPQLAELSVSSDLTCPIHSGYLLK